jgi:hypothetical protein
VMRNQFPPWMISWEGAGWGDGRPDADWVEEKCSNIGPYFSYSRMMRSECAGGKPKRITGVGSERFGGDDEPWAEPNNDGVISGGGDVAIEFSLASLKDLPC